MRPFGPVTLVYHGVGRPKPAADRGRLVTSPEHLESHVRLLKRLGYGFATAEDLLDSGPLPRIAVLTFDDGFRNWVTVALPVLARLGVRATFYVCPGWWGGRHPLVTGEEGRLVDEHEARRLLDAGMELGSHSMTHRDLRDLDEADLAFEVAASRSAVESLTNRPCRTFAYPYGLYDERSMRAVSDAGYGLAFDWIPGPWRPLAAPRLPAPPRHGAGRLGLKLLGLRRGGR